LKLSYSLQDQCILVGEHKLEILDGNAFMRIVVEDRAGHKLFQKINDKVAEIELQIKATQSRQNQIAQEEARQSKEMYRVRQIQKEQDKLAYEQKQLELEKQNFVDAKKQAIIDKAKSMGYSVQERAENGKIKLKLVKRIY
jgi:predicted transcriptional regulator